MIHQKWLQKLGIVRQKRIFPVYFPSDTKTSGIMDVFQWKMHWTVNQGVLQLLISVAISKAMRYAKPLVQEVKSLLCDWSSFDYITVSFISVCKPNAPYDKQPYNIWGISQCVPKGKMADGRAYTIPCKEGYSSPNKNGTCEDCSQGFYNDNLPNMNLKIGEGAKCKRKWFFHE